MLDENRAGQTYALPGASPAPAGLEKKARARRKPRAGKRDGTGEAAAEPALAPASVPATETGLPRQGARPRLVASQRDAPTPAANDTKVIQLDAFRKK
jgi:hypothetical protein